MIIFKPSLVLSLVAMTACGRSPLEIASRGVGSDAGLPPCASGLTQCGKRNVSLCYDLQRSPDHCGACGHACAPGIACQAGTCQQVSCKGPLSFKALKSITAGPLVIPYAYRPALGDFDGDGILDLAGIPELIDPGGILAGARLFTGVSLAYGAGDGTFPTARRIDTPQISYWMDSSADLNGDGILDLVSIRGDAPVVTVLRGSGNRSAPFVETTTYPTSQAPDKVVVADFDGDGRLDFVAGVASNLEYWRGQVTGGFEHGATLASRDQSAILQAVDWNHDGALDLIFGSSYLHLRYGRGDGTFDPVIVCALVLPMSDDGWWDLTFAPISIAADLDHDNVIDLVGRTKFFLGLDGCTPAEIVRPPNLTSAPFELADLNGDGNLDVVSASGLSLGDGQGGFAQPLSIPLHLSGTANPAVFLVGDLNRDGKLDVIAAGTEGWQVLLNTCE
jgi:hypothetical protein